MSASPSFWSRLLPARFRKGSSVVPVVKLKGTVGIGSPLRPALTLEQVNPQLERAFSRSGIAAVALSINSPGGAAVQSRLIYDRIRQLADEKEVRVIAFCEDVAASGGYMLALAADEIYADPSTIVGSIGVISSSFGLVEAIDKLGVERRIHTSGPRKAILDPFLPEKPDDVARLESLQRDVHETFKDMVRTRRGGRLNAPEEELFDGSFWSGEKARALGLIDGVGGLYRVLRDKFGEGVVIRPMARGGSWFMRRFGFIDGHAASPLSALAGPALAEGLVEAVEVRALWQRFGL